ncbi:MAG: beta-ketoacyl-ACP synthase II [Bacillota bacterium]
MKRAVITGMGVISPVGNTLDEFWQSLVDGRCGIDFITRFDAAEFKVKIAAEVKDFDPLKYMEKGDLRKTDLFVQYALAAAQQAMEHSALKVSDPYRFGVYVGSGIGGMDTFVSECRKLVEQGPRRVSPHFIPMMIANIAAGTLAMRHGAKGPCLPVVTACATSAHAIGEAFRAIKYGQADAILAGGTEAAINPLAVAGFTNCMALSTKNDPAGSSIPFDKRRDGFVMGEGAAILVVEEYEHALARGAKIYAEIVGYGNTCDAYHVTAPDPESNSAAEAVRQALREAGELAPAKKIYINAHGTSTPLNDKAETLAIKKAFGEDAYELMVSSTKSMTGHMLGAAGAAEAVACVKALCEGIAPPTIGYREPDEECDLDIVPNVSRQAEIGAALSLSLGFGGHNACLAFKRN